MVKVIAFNEQKAIDEVSSVLRPLKKNEKIKCEKFVERSVKRGGKLYAFECRIVRK